MGGTSQGFRAPHSPPDSGRTWQGDAVRDGHGGDPSRHPGQHLPAPHGPPEREARRLRPGRWDPVLLPEPAEAGRGGADVALYGSSGHPEDQGTDRPGKGQGRKGEGGGPWLKNPGYLFWNTSRRKHLSSRRQTCWRRRGSGRGCQGFPSRPDASLISTENLSNTLLTREGPSRIPLGPVSIRASSAGGQGARNTE